MKYTNAWSYTCFSEKGLKKELRMENVMCVINNLIDICHRFENGYFDILELQGLLRTVLIYDPDMHKINELLFEMDNDLEEIIFTKLENNYRQYGLNAVRDFLKRLEDIEGNC